MCYHILPNRGNREFYILREVGQTGADSICKRKGEGVNFTGRSQAMRVWLLLALAAALLAHGRALWADFAWDDTPLIRQNECGPDDIDWSRVWGRDIGACLPTGHASGYWRPLQTTAFLLVRKTFGDSPLPFHLLNLLLHLLAVWGVWRLGRALSLTPTATVAAALLFAAHPAHVEQVALASNLGGLLTVALLLHALAFAVGEGRRALLAAALFAVALLTKEEALALPALAIWATAFLPGAKMRETLRRSWPVIIALVALSALYLLWRWLGPVPGPLKPATTDWFGPVDIPVALGYYAVRLFSPLPGNPDLSALVGAWNGGCAQTAALIYLVVGIGAVALLLALLWRGGVGRLLAGLFVLAYLPYAGIAPLHTPLAEHYLYLASVPALLGAGVLFDRLRGRRIVLAVVVVAFVAGTAVAHGHWRNDQALWTHATRVACPGHRALKNRAAVMLVLGRHLEAETLLRRALKTAPSIDAELRASLGSVLLMRGKLDDATDQFEKALVLDKNNKRALSGLAVVRIREGWPGAALPLLKRALENHPNDAGLWSNLGVAQAKLEKYDEARVAFERALALDSSLAGAREALDALPPVD